MSFQSLSFLAFLIVTVSACLLAGSRNVPAGKALLACACLVFYLSGVSHPLAGLAVLLVGMAVTLATSAVLRAGRNRKVILAAAAGWHIAVLMVFKYTGFFTGGAVRIGWAPVGLSYFTFQQIWYLKEVFTGEYVPAKTGFSGTGDFFLYTFFFPTVTSGPILRPNAMFDQLAGKRLFRPGWQDASAGLCSICTGLVKKVLLADSFAVIVNNGWEHTDALSFGAAWLMILGYSLQLYLDFSGYCDIAAGAARLLGICLPQNFDAPYRSLSVTEFWKRWHITLTTFLRECIYFPLGGSRRGMLRTCLNILAVFLISGFWHGAGWTFLIWGALHGLAQVTERLLGKRQERLPKLLRWGMTFLFVSLAWIFFRAPDMSRAADVLQAVFCMKGAELPAAWLTEGLLEREFQIVRLLLPQWESLIMGVVLAALYAAGLLAVLYPRKLSCRLEEGRFGVLRSALLAAASAWAILSFNGVATFIYSNF